MPRPTKVSDSEGMSRAAKKRAKKKLRHLEKKPEDDGHEIVEGPPEGKRKGQVFDGNEASGQSQESEEGGHPIKRRTKA